MADNTPLLSLAAALERDADEIRALARPIDGATGPAVLSGGRLADSVDQLIDHDDKQQRPTQMFP